MTKPKGTEAWRQCVAAWLDGRSLHNADAFWYRPTPVNADGRHCDCCGSSRPKTLYRVSDGTQTYAIGLNCYLELERTGRFVYNHKEAPSPREPFEETVKALWG